MADGRRGNAAAMTTTPMAGAIVRQELGATQMEVRSETSVQAAEIEAMVKARVALARMYPRDIDVVRQRILLDCQRPLFADRAIYSKPVGKAPIEGPSVRFAEALMRHLGNLFVDATIAEETLEKRRIRVSAMDLETNATACADVLIEKTVERSNAEDREVLGQRTNKWGRAVFIVAATEDELLNKTNAAVSKMRRNKILELSPADIVDEAMALCNATLAKQDAADPAAARKRVLDAFIKLGVKAEDLKTYVGHTLDTLSPKEMQHLRAVHTAIKDGETSWQAVVEARGGNPKAKAPPAPATGATPAAQPPVPPHDPVTGVVDEPAEEPAVATASATAEALNDDMLSEDEKAIRDEVAALKVALAEATEKSVKHLLGKCKALPEPDRAAMLRLYEARVKELGGES